MTRGKFITLEGGEGVGKSTQARALGARLRALRLDVLETREPGGSAGAEAIRDLLLSGADDRWSAESEALLFAAARADHLAKTILPALDRGTWVLCDRFLDSSLAYQGKAGGLGLEAIRTLHRFASHEVMPDRTLILDLDLGAERARLRDEGRSDRIGGRDLAYHASVLDAFRAIAAQEPDRVRLVDAFGSPDDVTDRLIAQLADLIP
jgi:dTMP kinase